MNANQLINSVLEIMNAPSESDVARNSEGYYALDILAGTITGPHRGMYDAAREMYTGDPSELLKYAVLHCDGEDGWNICLAGGAEGTTLIFEEALERCVTIQKHVLEQFAASPATAIEFLSMAHRTAQNL